MSRIPVAFPVSVLLLTLSIPCAGQSLVEGPEKPVAPRVAQSQPQMPVDSSVIVVKPELTEEQLADLYMARKDYREAAQVYKRLTDQNPQNPVYLNKLGIALHQQAALGQALKYYEARPSKLTTKRFPYEATWRSSTAISPMLILPTRNTKTPSCPSDRRSR